MSDPRGDAGSDERPQDRQGVQLAGAELRGGGRPAPEPGPQAPARHIRRRHHLRHGAGAGLHLPLRQLLRLLQPGGAGAAFPPPCLSTFPANFESLCHENMRLESAATTITCVPIDTVTTKVGRELVAASAPPAAARSSCRTRRVLGADAPPELRLEKCRLLTVAPHSRDRVVAVSLTRRRC